MAEETTESETDEGKTFTQDDVDRIVRKRLADEKAKYSDYDDLKAKADRLDEQESKSKDEVTRLREENGKLKSDLDHANAQVLRHEVAAEKGVKPRWLSGTTREELEAAADEYLQDHPQAGAAGEGEEGSGDGKPNPPPSKKPTTEVTGGTEPATEGTEATDPAALAKTVPRF